MKAIVTIAFVIFFLVLIVPNVSSQKNSSEILNENKIIGSVSIESFETNGKICGAVNFSFILENNCNYILFLPSAKGESSKSKDPNAYSENDFYRDSYDNQEFEGKLNIETAQLYPFDRYELLFLLGLNKSINTNNESLSFSAVFNNTILYTYWNISYFTEPLDQTNYTAYANYLAINNPDLNKSIIENNLTDLYAMNIKITRSEWEFNKSLFLWIPPLSILIVILSSFSMFGNKEEHLKIIQNSTMTFFQREKRNHNFGNAIALYSGIAFSLIAFSIAIRAFVPPTLTFLETFVFVELFLSFALLTLAILMKYDVVFNNRKKAVIGIGFFSIILSFMYATGWVLVFVFSISFLLIFSGICYLYGRKQKK